MKFLKFVPLLILILANACGSQVSRGDTEASKDGKTYFAVIDDNGGHCGTIKLDGVIWPHPIGEKGLVAPGRHKIECGGWIEFDIPAGVIFKFNYWGP